MVGKGPLLLGGSGWRGEVATLDLGVGSDGLAMDWEVAISMVMEGCLRAYSEGNNDDLGRVAGGWRGPRGASGSMLVGTVATVWDGEIARMRLALESLPVVPVLLLSDSQAAISIVCNAVACRWARMADLKVVVDAIGDWASRGVPFGLA